MTFAEDMWYDCYDLDDLKWQDTLIDSVKVIENWYVVEKDYCTKCKSINIKVSKKGNKYCGEICRKKNEN